MSGKADLKYEQKLVCARMAIDCLKGDKILATQEDEDKFIVGLFSEERKFGLFKKGKPFPYFRCKRALKKDIFNPFLLGYAFKVFLEKKADCSSFSNEIKETSDGSDYEYTISLPDYAKYSVLRSYSLKTLYPFAWYWVKNELNASQVTRYLDVKCKNKTFKTIKPFLDDVARRKFKQFKCWKVGSEKWSADQLKMNYYRNRYNSICKKANLKDDDLREAKLFFQALEQELTDINNRAGDHYQKNRRFFKWIMLLSLFITVVNAINAALETSDKLFGEEVLKWILFVLPLLAVIFSSIQVYVQSKFKDFQPKETWLRHRMNFSILSEELEHFCEGLGEYKDISSDDSKKVKETINKFQEKIAKIRKNDYMRFFANMGVNIDNTITN